MLERWFVDFFHWLYSFGNSNFGTALVSAFIGSAAGAWGGAWAARHIAEAAKERDALLDEVRSCNAAIELAHGICSTFLNLKEQSVRALWEEYERQRMMVHGHHRLPATSRG
jgi:hypothetical protein